MKQILFDFWDFIKKPKDFQYSGNNKSYKWKVFFSLFIFNILFSILFSGLVLIINELRPLEHKFSDLDLNPIILFLTTVLTVPFLEEVVFRLGLRRKGILKNLFSEEKWNRYFSKFAYLSVITFALVHGSNFKFDSYLFILAIPFLTISQFVSGFINTYLRVRFNFWMGYLFHAFWNFFALLMVSFPNTISPKVLNITKEKYQLEVKEKALLNNLSAHTILYSMNNDTIYQLETKGLKTKTILKTLDSTEMKYQPISEYIDIHFTSKKGIPKDSILILLEEEGYIKTN